MNAQKGQRVKVVDAGATFNDYKNGDTGVVYRVDGEFGVHVTWDARRFTGEYAYKEDCRCEFLTHDEYEVVPA